IAEVGQQITRPGSPTHVILQGLARGRVLDFGSGRGYPLATVARHDDPPERTREPEPAMTTVLRQVATYRGMLPTAPEDVRAMVEAAGMPDEVKAKALAQAERLEQQPSHSPEIGIIRTYLEWLTELPWAVETPDHLSLAHAARILDEDHYGLEKVKERIPE